MGVHHPGHGAVADLKRGQRNQGVASITNSSIGRDGIRFYDGGKALFQGGGGVEIQDTGYIIINGSLTGLGEFNWEGTFVQTGQSTFTGPTTFTGTINATGNTAWSGIMSIVGELRVLPGGKIQVGNMIIDPADGGSVQFPNGARVSGDGVGGVRMAQGANQVYVGPGLVSMQYGTRVISITGSGHQMSGLDTAPSSLANGAVAGTIWADPTGKLFRIVAG